MHAFALMSMFFLKHMHMSERVLAHLLAHALLLAAVLCVPS